MQLPKYIIAIDGYSSTGKSTLAKSIAHNLGFIHIDSGAMYRAITLYGLRHFYNQESNQIEVDKLVASLPNIHLQFKEVEGQNHLFMNGEDVEHDIRTMEVSHHVSEIAKNEEIRNFLVDIQRKLAENNNIVMDGRDIGSVVFPDADIKFFIVADVEERAQRRWKELKVDNPTITLEEVKANLIERDRKDENRKYSPLKMADDAIKVDNTFSSKEETLQNLLRLIEERFDI